MAVGDAQDLVQLARHRVRYAGDAAVLERLYPGTFPRPFSHGDGIYLVDDQGHRFVDAGNHLGAAVIGHSRGEMADAIAEQVRTLEFSALQPGASHPYAVALAERLAKLVPVDDPVFSFTSSGSEANEAAFKTARAYHRRLGNSRKYKICSRRSSYHGSSYGAVSATGLPAFRDPFLPLVDGFVSLPHPFPGFCGHCSWDTAGGCSGSCIDETVEIIEREGPDTVAAIIAEPVSIAGAGVKIPPPTYWQTLRSLCDEYGILLIADEVITGFGRTGTMFGCDHWSVRPDMLTFAKGITSGYIPMGGAAVARHIQDAFGDSAFMHINTYAGHPVACAAAMKTLDIIEREDLISRSAAQGPVIAEAFEGIAARVSLPARASVIGAIGSIEFFLSEGTDAGVFAARLWHECYERGVLLRVAPVGQDVSLFFYPPLSIDAGELAEALARVAEAAIHAGAELDVKPISAS
jgi:adenosylmethionine-8-amino-7-oxononanoate aminotransferase